MTKDPPMFEAASNVGPSWRHFPVLALTLELRMADGFRLPNFAGSMFRGALGWALKDVCDPPVYSTLFETTSNRPGEKDALRPFVLVPPLGARRLKAGGRLSLELRLFGPACEYLPEFTEAVMRAGERGLGRQQVGFELTKVLVNDGGCCWVAFDERMGWEKAYTPLPTALGAFSGTQTSPGNKLSLMFLTPTRLTSQGVAVRVPEFPVVLRAAYRRLKSLLELHGSGHTLPDLRDQKEEVDRIQLHYHDLEWFDWDRTSQRQGRRHAMGGLVGRVVYHGGFRPQWLEILSACELLHLGKGSTFGMGAFRLDHLSSDNE